MKTYFKRLLWALFNKSYDTRDLRSIGVFRRQDLNPEFLKTIDSIEEKLNHKGNSNGKS